MAAWVSGSTLSRKRTPALVLASMNTTRGFFRQLGSRSAGEGGSRNLTPLEFMRRYGAFEIKNKIGKSTMKL